MGSQTQTRIFRTAREPGDQPTHRRVGSYAPRIQFAHQMPLFLITVQQTCLQLVVMRGRLAPGDTEPHWQSDSLTMEFPWKNSKSRPKKRGLVLKKLSKYPIYLVRKRFSVENMLELGCHTLVKTDDRTGLYRRCQVMIAWALHPKDQRQQPLNSFVLQRGGSVNWPMVMTRAKESATCRARL